MNLANIVNQTLGMGNPFGKSKKMIDGSTVYPNMIQTNSDKRLYIDDSEVLNGENIRMYEGPKFYKLPCVSYCEIENNVRYFPKEFKIKLDTSELPKGMAAQLVKVSLSNDAIYPDNIETYYGNEQIVNFSEQYYHDDSWNYGEYLSGRFMVRIDVSSIIENKYDYDVVCNGKNIYYDSTQVYSTYVYFNGSTEITLKLTIKWVKN